MSETLLHGTPTGWQEGCRGAACANHGTDLDTCDRAWVRYCGDYGYRKRVDAGWTAEELHEADIAEHVIAVDVERATRAAEREAARVARLVPKPPKAVREPKQRPERVVREKPAKLEEYVSDVREIEHGTEASYWLGCRRDSICPSSPSCAEVYDQHVIDGTAQEIRKAHRPTGNPTGRPRIDPKHGTMYGFQMGCKTIEGCPESPSCVEVNRQYHRDYQAKRRVQGGAGLKSGKLVHGTASGYQLGCHDRVACPGDEAGMKCPDASLAEERRRRRQQGTPERAMVAAKPVIEHVNWLKGRGLGAVKIAQLAGVGHTAVSVLIYGRADRATKFPERVTADLAAKILAVRA